LGGGHGGPPCTVMYGFRGLGGCPGRENPLYRMKFQMMANTV